MEKIKFSVPVQEMAKVYLRALRPSVTNLITISTFW